MQVTLKKAAALATAMSAITVALPVTVSLSIYSDEDVETAISNTVSQLGASVKAALALQDAVYSIRSLIGKANEGEINNLLTSRARLDKELAILNGVANNLAPLDFTAITKKREALKNSEGKSYLSSEAISVSIPTGDLAMPVLKTLKKERLKIEDRLAELNFSKTIELPEDVVTLLTEFDLI